jgi:hypothetical protein
MSVSPSTPQVPDDPNDSESQEGKEEAGGAGGGACCEQDDPGQQSLMNANLSAGKIAFTRPSTIAGT